MPRIPEIDAILDRAHASYRETMMRTGQPPTSFLVTEQEWAVLCLGDGYGNTRHPLWVLPDDYRIFGMTIRLPQRMAWYCWYTYMEHCMLQDILPVHVWEQRLPHEVDPPSRCRTVLPSRPCLEVTCPCGHVIWDMATCTAWGHVDVTASRQLRPEAPPMLDSETSSDEAWEAGVHAMIAEANRRRGA